MNDKQYTKCFYNDRTNATYKTMKSAKESSEHPCIYRCWMKGEKIIAIAQLFTCGTSVRTIKSADEKISEALRNGTVGKGKKDNFFVD